MEYMGGHVVGGDVEKNEEEMDRACRERLPI